MIAHVGHPNLHHPKLPFWDTVSLSYSTYFGNFIDALRASWLWLLVIGPVMGFANWQQWSWMATAMANLQPGKPPKVPQPTEMWVLMNIGEVLFVLAGVSIAVAWHRLMILNEHPSFSASNVTTKNFWRYIGVGFAIFLIVFLPIAVIMLSTFPFLLFSKAPSTPPPAGIFVVVPLFFGLFIIATAAGLRLTLLLPARAVDDLNLTFKQTWTRTRGNTWRLFWGFVVTTMPPALLEQIAFVFAVGPPHPAMAGSETFAARMAAASTIGVIYYLLTLPIGIGFLSHAYRHFIRGALEPT